MKEAFTYAKNVSTAKFVNKGNADENKLYAEAFSEAIKIFIFFNKPLLVVKCLKKMMKTNHDPYLEHFILMKALLYRN